MNPVYSNKIFDLIELPNKHTLVRKKGGVVAILAWLDEDKILLERQYRDGPDAEIYEIPAGHVEKDEMALDAAKRELKEETGYEATTWTYMTSFYSSPGFTDERIILYEAKGLKFVGRGEIEHGEENLNTIAVPIKWIIEQKKEELDAKTMVAVLMALNRPKTKELKINKREFDFNKVNNGGTEFLSNYNLNEEIKTNTGYDPWDILNVDEIMSKTTKRFVAVDIITNKILGETDDDVEALNIVGEGNFTILDRNQDILRII
jgi:ADP-ribose pyrophosphatase